MQEDPDYVGALDVILEAARETRGDDEDRRARAEASRVRVDDARLALSELAAPAVAIVALRLMGAEVDWEGRPVTEDREKTAMAVLDRVGIPRLRATAVAASLAFTAATPSPVYGAYGAYDAALPPAGEGGDAGPDGLDPASVDWQIDQFLRGAAAARDLGQGPGGRREGGP